MKYKVFAVTFLFFAGFQTASAFTINYSALRRIFAPQLSTVSSSLSATTTISDFFLGKNITETVLSGSSSGLQTINDVVYDYFSTGNMETTCSVFVQDGGNTPVFTSATPSVATIDQSGNTTYVSNGTAYFNARIGRRTRTVSCAISRTNNVPSHVFNSIATNSVIQEMKDSVDTRINGLTPSTSNYNLYSAINDTTHSYTRNTNIFANDVDFTCIPTLSGAIGIAQTMGVLVAPDIMIQANHSHPSGVMYFTKNDNTTITRSIISGSRIGTTDIWVAKLDSDVPAGITPCKIFPSTVFTNSISTTSVSYLNPPVVFTNQNRVLRLGIINYNPYMFFLEVVSIIRGTGDYYDWYSKPCCGDSGSPAFALVNGQAVLLGVWYSAFSVSNLSNYITQINAAAASLGSSHTLSTADLSGYLSF